jgi:Zn-dependent protease with chaperone function
MWFCARGLADMRKGPYFTWNLEIQYPFMRRLNASQPIVARSCTGAIFSPYFLCYAGLMLCWLGAGAQDFVPVKEDGAVLTNLAGVYQQRYKEESDRLPALNKKDFQEIYDERWKNIKEKFDKQEIYTSTAAQEYLDALVAQIVRANPVLKDHPFHCYFSRTYVPNAAYIGEGIILFNMGLFYRLTNESQAAFILCHEISHYLLQHQEKSIGKYVAAVNSPEVQAQLRKIKESEFRKHEQEQTLVKGLAFDSRRHSRDHESEADSMGVELMRQTPFDLMGAMTTLALLDSIDKDAFNTESCLRQTFNSSSYPFRKKWIAREEGLLGGHAHVQQEELEDSLKTHPDCPLRMRQIAPLVGTGGGRAAGIGGAGSAGGGGRAFVVDSVKFRTLAALFRYEVIEYAYVSDEYTESLYLSLKLLQDRPGDVYGVAQVGRLLNGLYQAQKGHTLGKLVDLPSPAYPANYNLLLQFIQNLYREDLASINYYFLSPYHPQLDYYTTFKKAYEESAKSVKE